MFRMFVSVISQLVQDPFGTDDVSTNTSDDDSN
jgi:hypothetical protein